METILIPVIIVAAIGLILGLGLAAASKIFSVPVNEKTEKIKACLPGANCGGCGFSGCEGYATALSEGKTKDMSLCGPGGREAAMAIASALGISDANIGSELRAVVMCQGNSTNVGVKLDYQGVKSCQMAAQLFGGPKDCLFSCLGYGDCVEKCEYNAITICDGVARINGDLCRACKKCAAVCPRGCIEFYPVDQLKAAVYCRNRDKGAVARKACKTACIGCTKCAKNCKNEAITIENNLAHVDINKCTGCGECYDGCPTGAINMIAPKRR